MNVCFSKLWTAGFALFTSAAICTEALAGSTTQPGETVGLALGAPLPEGLYFVDTGSYGNDRGFAYNSNLGVNIPVIAWSSPWVLFGGRWFTYVAVPSVDLGVPHYTGKPGSTISINSIYNPALLTGFAWDLGGGWGVSDVVGGYAPVNTALGQDYWTFNNRFAVSYTGNDWNLTAHLIYGVTSKDNLTYLRTAPDYLNLDLTAAKTIGKWTLGAVGFGSWDVSGVSEPSGGVYHKQSQFALGALVGYNFGPVNLQTYVTRDVYTDNYVNYFGSKVYETRGWIRVIVPLWNPPAPSPAVVAKY
jgi:hypothetical protein